MNKPHVTIQRLRSSWEGWCVNYNGLMDRLKPITHCKAGVEYKSVETPVEFTYSYGATGHRYENNRAMPCFKHENGLSKGCASCRFPNAQEIKAHHDEADGWIKRTIVARAAIVEEDKTVSGLNPENAHRWNKPQENYYSGAGVMECPVCKTGKLHYSRAGYNGHVHAKCSTEGCVAWME